MELYEAELKSLNEMHEQQKRFRNILKFLLENQPFDPFVNDEIENPYTPPSQTIGDTFGAPTTVTGCIMLICLLACSSCASSISGCVRQCLTFG
jgi:hypothetical protein